MGPFSLSAQLLIHFLFRTEIWSWDLARQRVRERWLCTLGLWIALLEGSSESPSQIPPSLTRSTSRSSFYATRHLPHPSSYWIDFTSGQAHFFVLSIQNRKSNEFSFSRFLSLLDQFSVAPTGTSEEILAMKKIREMLLLRFLKICTSWVEASFQDFHDDIEASTKFLEMIEQILGPSKQSWLEALKKTFQRKVTRCSLGECLQVLFILIYYYKASGACAVVSPSDGILHLWKAASKAHRNY